MIHLQLSSIINLNDKYQIDLKLKKCNNFSEIYCEIFRDCRMTEIEEPGNDDEVAEKLWNISMKLTGLKK